MSYILSAAKIIVLIKTSTEAGTLNFVRIQLKLFRFFKTTTISTMVVIDVRLPLL